MKRSWRILALAMLAACLTGLRAAAPPTGLDGPRRERLHPLDRPLRGAISAGSYEEAEKRTREEWRLRRRWQGEKHRETVDARWMAERWRRLSAVAEKDRLEVVRASALAAQGQRLYLAGRYAEAEAIQRRSLDLLRRTLGEGH